jgi:hypothetical protein
LLIVTAVPEKTFAHKIEAFFKERAAMGSVAKFLASVELRAKELLLAEEIHRFLRD